MLVSVVGASDHAEGAPLVFQIVFIMFWKEVYNITNIGVRPIAFCSLKKPHPCPFPVVFGISSFRVHIIVVTASDLQCLGLYTHTNEY